MVNEITSMSIISTAMQNLMSNGIDHAERIMLSETQAPCSVVHHFSPGIYIREVHLPAGIFAIGHKQKTEHLNIMLKGRVLMHNEDGTATELIAPLMFTGKPGRKMGYVLEDVVWQNIYATNERDIQVLESVYLDKSPMWEASELARISTARDNHAADRCDFLSAINEAGFTTHVVQDQSENLDDQCPMPMGSWKVKTGVSPIHGTGIFLTADAVAGELLGPARLNGLRTPLGRYTNHSVKPNARMAMHLSGNVTLVATQNIKGCVGGIDGDEVTICYRQALELSGITCSTTGETT